MRLLHAWAFRQAGPVRFCVEWGMWLQMDEWYRVHLQVHRAESTDHSKMVVEPDRIVAIHEIYAWYFHLMWVLASILQCLICSSSETVLEKKFATKEKCCSAGDNEKEIRWDLKWQRGRLHRGTWQLLKLLGSVFFNYPAAYSLGHMYLLPILPVCKFRRILI